MVVKFPNGKNVGVNYKWQDKYEVLEKSFALSKYGVIHLAGL